MADDAFGPVVRTKEHIMGLNLRVVVPLGYALVVVVALLIDRTVGGVIAVVGAILVGLFFVTYGRRANRS
jgi:hypothetical protein